MSFTWRPLPLPACPTAPLLLVSAEVGAISYSIRITDMANIWEERMERRDICMRAWSENTTIDPSDTPENMTKLLASLTSALDPRQPGHADTSIALSTATAPDAGDNGLTLTVTCALRGLAPFKWPLHLRRSPASAVATYLVLPLIEAHCARKREVESLIQALGQKDAVLAKLSDKLEAMGIGLEHVFTALSGKKKVARLAANEKVKGLAPFDLTRWEADMSHGMKGTSDVGHLVRTVFGDATPRYIGLLNPDTSHVPDRWWRGLGDMSQVPSSEHATVATLSSHTKSPESCPIPGEQDDEFQIQATPPRLQRKHKTDADRLRAQQAPPSAGEDAEESLIPDSNPPPATLASAAPLEPCTAPLAVLDASGTSMLSARPQPSNSGLKRDCQLGPKETVDDSETASEAEDNDDDDAALTPAPASPGPASLAKSPTTPGVRKGNIGLIGGGAREDNTRQNDKNPALQARTDDAAAAHNKLGVIGNKTGRKCPPMMPAREPDDRGRSTARVEKGGAAEAPARETSQERANRRREELKRELEVKATASPARKKRRF